MPTMQILPVRENQPLHGDPRYSGTRDNAERLQPFLPQRQAPIPLHGDFNLFEFYSDA